MGILPNSLKQVKEFQYGSDTYIISRYIETIDDHGKQKIKFKVETKVQNSTNKIIQAQHDYSINYDYDNFDKLIEDKANIIESAIKSEDY